MLFVLSQKLSKESEMDMLLTDYLDYIDHLLKQAEQDGYLMETC